MKNAQRMFTALQAIERLFASDSIIPEVAEAREALAAADPKAVAALAAKRNRLANMIAAYKAGDTERLDALVAVAEAEAERDRLNRA